MKPLRIERLALAVAIVGFAGAAQADAIDGDWCSPDELRALSIDGPRIFTPGKQSTEGNYSRHAFSYVVPDGESAAGQGVNLQLLNDNVVLISVGDGAPETWHRCDLSA